MTFPIPARRAEILSPHVAKMAGYLNGAPGDDYIHNVNRYGNSTTLYADQVTQVDETNGLIANFRYGPAGSETDVLTITKNGVTILGGIGLASLTQTASAPSAPAAGLTTLYALTAGTIGYRASGGAAHELVDTDTVQILSNKRDKGNRGHDIRAYGTITTGNIVGATAAVTVTAGAVAGFGSIVSGDYYARVPRVTISNTGGGVGTGATAHAVLTGNAVTSIVVDNGGSGYAQATTIVTIESVWYTPAAAITVNTATIQAAIDAVDNRSCEVWFPNTVIMTNQLDVTNFANGVKFRGSGGNGTRLIPGVDVHGQVWIDTIGCAGIGWYNIGLGDTAMPCIPSVGVLYGNSTTGGNSSNVHDSYEWRMDGFYSVACVYGAHLNSSQFFNSTWSNSYLSGGAAGMYLSYQNKASIASPFATLSSTPAGITTVSFFGCEWHGDGQSAGNYAFRGESVQGVRWVGCHMSANVNATSVVRFDTDAQAGPNPGYCDWLTFDNCHFYTENSPAPVGIFISNPDTTGYVNDLILNGCAMGVTGTLVNVQPSTTLRNFVITGNIDGGSATALLAPTGGTLTLEDCNLDCSGLTLSTGGAAVTRGIIKNPGTLTIGTASTCWIQDAGGNLILRSGLLQLGGVVASAGSIRDVNNTSWRMRNAANNGDLITTSFDSGGNVIALSHVGTGSIGSFSLGRSDVNIGAVDLFGPTGTLGAVTLGKTSSSSTVTIQSTTGVSLTYGATTRLASTSTGVATTGVHTATTGFASGTTPATTGGMRLTNNAGVYIRSVGGVNIPVGNLDASDNMLIGDIASVSLMQLQAANGFRFATSGHFEFGTAALATTATAGFPCIPTCAGTPTGAAAPTTGLAPFIIDTTNGRFYARYGGAWHFVALV